MSADLNQLIRDVAATMPDDATPRDIAEAVVDKASAVIVEHHLVDLVVRATEDVLRKHRRAGMDNVGGAAGGGSAKLRRRRDWWLQTLASRVPVGDGMWKLLGDCTVDDLRYCISEREELIKRTTLQINNYRHLIAKMGEHKAVTVSGLTAEQVDL